MGRYWISYRWYGFAHLLGEGEGAQGGWAGRGVRGITGVGIFYGEVLEIM